MGRNTTRLGRLLLLASVSTGQLVLAQQPAAPAHNDVVIRNAVVMTVTHGNVKNGSIYIKDGKIAAVGELSTHPRRPR